MSARVVCLLAVLLAAASASPVNNVPQVQDHETRPLPRPVAPIGMLPKDTGNANDYIDMVLANLNAILPARVDVPDFGTMFNLEECYMFGLDSGLSRSGDATMVTMEQTVKFTAAIKTGQVGMTCRWHYMLLRGDASGTTDVIDISTGIQLELTSGSSPLLTEFRVMEVADIETDITGLTFLFNWIAEDIADIIINGYKDEMVVVIEGLVKDLLQQVLDQIVIP